MASESLLPYKEQSITLTQDSVDEIFTKIVAADRAIEYQERFEQVYDPAAGPEDGLTQERLAQKATDDFLELVKELNLGEMPAEDIQGLCDLYVSMAITRPEAYSLLSGHYALAMRAMKELGARDSDGALHPEIQKLLTQLAQGDALGVFSLTEAAVGSNAKDLQTTATYDEERGVFILHTPPDPGAPEGALSSARKIPPNVAYKDKPVVNVVAARIRTKNGDEYKDEGIGLFVVPLHSETQPDGISIIRVGDKASAAMSHADVTFDNVEVPEHNWLPGKTARIENGKYCNDEPDHGKRYHEAIGPLGWGRIGLTAGSVAAAQVALKLFVPYAQKRNGGGRNTLIENGDVLNELASDVVATFAMTALSNEVRKKAAEQETDANALELLAWLEKAMITEKAEEIVIRTSKRTGFRGMFRKNLFPVMRGHIEGALTAEGPSRTLEVSAGRSLLGQMKSEKSKQRLQEMLDISPHAYNSMSGGLNLGELINEHATTVPGEIERKRHNNIAKSLAAATVEKLTYDAMAAASEKVTGPAQAAMRLMTDIYAIERVIANSSKHRRHERMTNEQEFALEDELQEKYDALAPLIPQLVEAFKIPDNLLNAPIAADNYVAAPM